MSFCCPKTHFPNKWEPNLEIEWCSVPFFVWYLSKQISFNPVSLNPEKPGTKEKDWNFSSKQNSPRNHSLWFGISGSAKRGRVFSWVGLMFQNSWQLQLIWKLISLICFHRALFFTSQVSRFCWVPDVYFTSSRCLKMLLPLISILSNLITDASQEACWIKGILVKGHLFFWKKVWSHIFRMAEQYKNGLQIQKSIEPGGIACDSIGFRPKWSTKRQFPRQMITRVCI